MEQGENFSKEGGSFRNKPKAGMMKRLCGLFVGILVIWILMAYIGPWGRQTASLRPIMNFIEERGIDATAYYYTGIEEFAEAEINITHSMRYTPTGPARGG